MWKIPPTNPGEIALSFNKERNVFETARVAHNCTRARAVFGTMDLNETHGFLDNLNPQDIPPASYAFGHAVYRFHRSEILGDLISHVYLMDEGALPASVENAFEWDRIVNDTELSESDKAEALKNLDAKARFDAENQRVAAKQIRAQMEPILRQMSDSNARVLEDVQKPSLISQLKSLFGGVKNDG